MFDNLNKFVYILGPNKDKNEEFIGKYFSVEKQHIPEIIKTSTEMIDPTNAIHAYIILDKNEDWFFHYSGMTDVVLVKEF